MIKEFKTRTGAIYCDTDKKLEYLYVGDYGKENNIKADFLGFTEEINQVERHLGTPLFRGSRKWSVFTVQLSSS